MHILRFTFPLLLAVVALSLPQSADAQPDTTRWTPKLSTQYDQITDTEISPDGEQVAYVVREAVMDKTTSTYRQHIHVAAVDGWFDVQYTRGEHSNFSPRWTPFGDRRKRVWLGTVWSRPFPSANPLKKTIPLLLRKLDAVRFSLIWDRGIS